MAGRRTGLALLTLAFCSLTPFTLAEVGSDDVCEGDACDADTSSLLEYRSKEQPSGPSGCVEVGKYHFPKMEGHRIEVSRWEHCQAYCRVTQGCQFFSFWPDGGCELQSAPGEYRTASSAYSGVVSGPASCGEVTPGTINLLDMAFLYCFDHPNDSCCKCGTCCLPYCSNSEWTLRSGCNYKAGRRGDFGA